MGSASAIVRRWISSSGVLSSRRMMSTGRMNSSEPASAPCLMLPPTIDESGSIAYRFHCLANNEELVHTNKIGGAAGEVQLPIDTSIESDVVFVGSSHGWLGLYNRRNSDLLLSNPIAGRHIKLPPLHAADRLVLSSSLEKEGEGDELAFVTFGSRRRVGFCSPRRSNEWSLLGGEDSDRAYDSLAYSSRHKRLFCISEEEPLNRDSRIECWNVDVDGAPSLDWAHEHREELEFMMERVRPERSEFLIECFQMRYLVCAEHSGELFLVVRHVNLRAGPLGSLVHKIIIPPERLRGYHYLRTPYKTVDFDVYRIDLERRGRGKVVYMDASLGGLAMFVGIGDSFAIPADTSGVKPDCVYFTDENRLVDPTRFERTNYGGHDNGIFRYKHKDLYPCCDFYPIQFNKIRKILPLPLWFTPTPTPTPNYK